MLYKKYSGRQQKKWHIIKKSIETLLILW
jgi:hypothetical protein